MFDELASWHSLFALLTFKKYELTVILKVYFHSHSDHLFNTKFAYLDTIRTLLSMITHLLARYPVFAARVEAHDKFITAHSLMFLERAIRDFFWASITIIDALDIE